MHVLYAVNTITVVVDGTHLFCVQQAVKDIEVRINELELSKVSSNRSIDDINDEIKKFQQEKAKIQREHINYFYYF